MAWKVHGMLASSSTISAALTIVLLVSADRATQMPPTTDSSRIGSALRICIGESVRPSATERAGETIAAPSSTPSQSAIGLLRATPMKIRTGSTTIAIGAPYSTRSTVSWNSSTPVKLPGLMPPASLAAVIQ